MDREFLPPSPFLDKRRFLVTHTSYPRVRAKRQRKLGGVCTYAHTHGCNPLPLDPHHSPSRNDDDERDNQLTHTRTVSGQYWLGPFLGALLATTLYVCLKQYVTLTSFPPPSPSPSTSWGFVFFCASSKSLDSDAK